MADNDISIIEAYTAITGNGYVERSNEASVKIITKNGGKYERSFIFEGKEADVYMINLQN